jgi:hypothetical protein
LFWIVLGYPVIEIPPETTQPKRHQPKLADMRGRCMGKIERNVLAANGR